MCTVRTVDVKSVRLDDIFVALSVAGVVAGVNEPDVVNVKSSIGEDFELVFGQLSQVQSVSTPNNRRCRWSRHVALDLDIVSNSGRNLIQFLGFVQWYNRHAYTSTQPNKIENTKNKEQRREEIEIVDPFFFFGGGGNWFKRQIDAEMFR